MSKRLIFISGNELPRTRDGSDYLYRFSLVDSSFIDQPEENYYTTQHRIKVGISGTMEAAWLARQKNIEFIKVCYEYGKRELIQKVKDGIIQEYQEYEITSLNHPHKCPFQSDKINYHGGAYFDFEVGDKIMEDISLLQMASNIIDFRDFINSILKERHGKKLFLLAEERDLLQLFRSANTIEEFVYRISALKSFATNLNEIFLRELTNNYDNEVKTIQLLEIYLKTLNNYDKQSANTLKKINRLRQMYPIHGDNVTGVQEAHSYFGIEYPILNSSEAWKKVLLSYQDSLKRTFDMVKG